MWLSILNTLIYLIVFVAIVFGTLLLMEFIDKYCSMGPISAEAGYLDRGEVAKIAGLMGMTIEERRIIIKKIMESRMFKYENKQENRGEIELTVKLTGKNPESTDTAAKTDQVCIVTDHGNSHEKNETEGGLFVEMETGINFKSDLNLSLHEENANSDNCIICLDDYAEEQDLVTGIHCSHTFHAHCIIDWLERNDVCPICRKQMISPLAYRSAAQGIIDGERIEQLVHGLRQKKEYETELDPKSGYPFDYKPSEMNGEDKDQNQRVEVDISQTAMYNEVQQQMLSSV